MNPFEDLPDDELTTRIVYAGVMWATGRLKTGKPIPSLFFAIQSDGEVLTMPVDMSSPLFPAELLRVQKALQDNDIPRYIFIAKCQYAVRETDPANPPKTKEEAMALLGHDGPGLPPDAKDAVQIIFGDSKKSMAFVFDITYNDDGSFKSLDMPEDPEIRCSPGGPLGELLIPRETTH